MLLQPGKAAGDAAGDRARGQVERLADGLVALVAGEEAVEDLAAVLRGGCERLVHGERLLEERQGVVGLGQLELLLGGRPLACVYAEPVDAETPGQLCEPGLDGGVVPELVEMLVGAREDFLEDVLGVAL